MHSILDGASDIVQDVHMTMLKTAFQDSNFVTIGLKSDKRATKTHKCGVKNL
jgi:phosphopantetheine adenylyltransferase